MSSIADVWDDPADLALADKVSAAATELLQANAKLMEWTEGRIFRVPFFDDDDGRTCPDIQVSSTSTTQDLQLANATDAQMVVAIAVRWSDCTRDMTLDEPAIGTVFAEIERALWANSQLYDTTSFPGETLAPLGFAGSETIALEPEGFEDDESLVNFFAVLEAVWRTKLDTTTRRLH